MPIYQNSTVDSDALILGNYAIYSAATSGGTAGTFTNLGAGILNGYGHNWEKYDAQAGNAPDPVEGIASETFTLDFELIEYNATALTEIMCGAITATATTVLSTITGGGVETLTPRAFKLINVSGAYTTTVLVHKATTDTGLQFTSKSDNDTDPVNAIPLTVTGKVDATKTAGTQLFSITRTIVP